MEWLSTRIFPSQACVCGEGQVANRLLHINLTTDNKFSTLPMMPSLEGAEKESLYRRS